MRSFILSLSLACCAALAAAAPATARWTGAASSQSRCPDQPTAHLARPGKGALHRKLTDLPPGEAFLAVYRRDADGCIVPVKVNFRSAQPRRRQR